MAEWSERKNDEIFYRIANVEDRVNGLAARLDKMQRSLIQDKPKEPETFHLSAPEGFIALSALNELAAQVRKEHPFQVHGDYDTYCDYNQGWQDALDRLDSLLPTVEG